LQFETLSGDLACIILDLFGKQWDLVFIDQGLSQMLLVLLIAHVIELMGI
jgi:hypothetical protein